MIVKDIINVFLFLTVFGFVSQLCFGWLINLTIKPVCNWLDDVFFLPIDRRKE